MKFFFHALLATAAIATIIIVCHIFGVDTLSINGPEGTGIEIKYKKDD